MQPRILLLEVYRWLMMDDDERERILLYLNTIKVSIKDLEERLKNDDI